MRDQIGGLDELLSSILQASLARTSLSDNEDTRKISAWAGIIAVPTAIAGIYGMNFRHMPELEWRLGYPLIIAVIVVLCVLHIGSVEPVGPFGRPVKNADHIHKR